jgi:hypothetical protein
MGTDILEIACRKRTLGYYSYSSSGPHHCQLSYALISLGAYKEIPLAILGATKATITEPNKQCLTSSLT